MAHEVDMAMPRMRPLTGALAAALLCIAFATQAEAHPHVWITFETTVLHEKGAFVGLRHKWTFDEFYTAMAIEGLDKNRDGKYDREELAELAKVNIDGLKDFAFFTFVTLAGHELKVDAAGDYWLEHADGILSLRFTLPFARPVLMEAKGLAFSVYDPTYFIAFEPAKADPVKLGAGAPKACKMSVGPSAADGGKATALGETMSPQQRGAFALGYAKAISIDCSGP
jgi:ABC-type uncharacterized transport system substrate-binding protein